MEDTCQLLNLKDLKIPKYFGQSFLNRVHDRNDKFLHKNSTFFSANFPLGLFCTMTTHCPSNLLNIALNYYGP